MPSSDALWLTDVAHHHLALGVLCIFLGNTVRAFSLNRDQCGLHWYLAISLAALGTASSFAASHIDAFTVYAYLTKDFTARSATSTSQLPLPTEPSTWYETPISPLALVKIGFRRFWTHPAFSPSREPVRAEELDRSKMLPHVGVWAASYRSWHLGHLLGDRGFHRGCRGLPAIGGVACDCGRRLVLAEVFGFCGSAWSLGGCARLGGWYARR